MDGENLKKNIMEVSEILKSKRKQRNIVQTTRSVSTTLTVLVTGTVLNGSNLEQLGDNNPNPNPTTAL